MNTERLYNIIARNDKTGLHRSLGSYVVMTAYPDTHKNCMTIIRAKAQISKMTQYAWRTIFIEEA